jgi:hypothetical protein
MMDKSLVAALHVEEHAILAELRGSLQYRRLEEIRQLLGLYAEQPAIRQAEDAPIGAFLDAMMGDPLPRRAQSAASQPDIIALRYERAIA